MKLVASVSITSWLQPNSKSRPSTASLRIGCQLGSKETQILYQTTQNMTGTHYKVLGNIERLFVRCVEEGKATIRFRVPAHDMCISGADKIQLKCFLQILKNVVECKTMPSNTLRLSNLSEKTKVAKIKTSWSITTKDEYPILKSFPKCLETLSITGIEMKRIDSRVLELFNLTVLNLSDNSIKDLPESLGELRSLSTLNLSKNQLGDAESGYANWLWMNSPHFIRQLRTLNLGFNNLSEVPPDLMKLKALVFLVLNDNNLEMLPGNIYKLVNLKHFAVANNKLKALPCNIVFLSLQHIDIGGNPTLNEPYLVNDGMRDVMGVPSLVELAARTIINTGLRYSVADIPKMVLNYLMSAKYCSCRSACFERCYEVCISCEGGRWLTADNITCGSINNIINFTYYFCGSCKSIPTVYRVVI